MQIEDPAIERRVVHEKDYAADAAVALLRLDAAVEGLGVTEARLRLGRGGVRLEIDHQVPRPPIPLDGKRNLGSDPDESRASRISRPIPVPIILDAHSASARRRCPIAGF